MRTSCINHPAKEPLLIIRAWQVQACNGDHCAAALLSFFEYWHNIKLEQAGKAVEANDVAEKHGVDRTQDESLVQWHTNEQLAAGMLGLYSKRKIIEAVTKLAEKGFIRVFRNPNPRFAFDNTNHFIFNDSAVNDWLEARPDRKGSIVVQKGPTVGRKGATVGRKGPILISETTVETTTKTTGRLPAPTGPTRPESGQAILDADGDPKQETTLAELEAPAPPSKFKSFVELWSQSYEAHIGAPYPFMGGRDGKAAKALMSNCRTATELVELAAWCWGNLTGYVQQQCLTIHGFAAQQAVVQGMRAQREGKFKKDVLTPAQRAANVKAGDGWKNELADW